MKLFIQQYFGKDWKFFWTTNIVWEKFVLSTHFNLVEAYSEKAL